MRLILLVLMLIMTGSNAIAANILEGAPQHDIQAAQVRVFLHLVQGDGANPDPLERSKAESSVALLNEDFAETPIMFEVVDVDTITGSQYSDMYHYYDELVTQNAHSDAIDIYFLPPEYDGGWRARTSSLTHKAQHKS